MQLAIKLVGFLVLGIVVLLAFDLYLALQRETDAFRQDMKHDAEVLANTMRESITIVWRTNGEASALAMLESSKQHLPNPLGVARRFGAG